MVCTDWVFQLLDRLLSYAAFGGGPCTLLFIIQRRSVNCIRIFYVVYSNFIYYRTLSRKSYSQ